MGGGFMADNKDMSMLQKPPQHQHLQQQQQQQQLHHHLHQQHLHPQHLAQNPSINFLHRSPSVGSSSSSSPFFPRPAPFLRPNLPPVSSTDPHPVGNSNSNTNINTLARSSPSPSPKPQKKKLLKFILKVPTSTSNSNPNPNSPQASPSVSASASPSSPHSSSSSSPSPSPSSSPEQICSLSRPPYHLKPHQPQQAKIPVSESKKNLPRDLRQAQAQHQQHESSSSYHHNSSLNQEIKSRQSISKPESQVSLQISHSQLNDLSYGQSPSQNLRQVLTHHIDIINEVEEEEAAKQQQKHNLGDQLVSPHAKRQKLHQLSGQETQIRAVSSTSTQQQEHYHASETQQQQQQQQQQDHPSQISSKLVKKLPNSPSQGPHGMSQSPKIPVANHHNLAVSSTPASVQSSPSLSVAASSDDAQKPSKKRKLRPVVESTDSHVVHAKDGPAHVASGPYVTPLVDASVSKPQLEHNYANKDTPAACSSPKAAAAQDGRVSRFVPAKQLLKGILDRLQKKDKFGVFAEPVDANEVPNYYDIIKDPMDFGTMRKRIASSYYSSLDPFKRDIFLICDNAMKFNAKGTVYYRHARAIKDVAEKILEELEKAGPSLELSDDFVNKQKSGGPTAKKSHKKQNGPRSLLERVAFDSGVTLASGVDFDRTDSPGEAYQEDGAGYFLRSCGVRSQFSDDNRRSSYKPVNTSASQGWDSLLSTICGECPQYVPTGYQADFPYARSLSRFASDLGPAVWNIVSEKLRRALPPGVPFGPGWVVEKESPTGNFPPGAVKQLDQVQHSAIETQRQAHSNENTLSSSTNVVQVQSGNPASNSVDVQSSVTQSSNASMLNVHSVMSTSKNVKLKPPGLQYDGLSNLENSSKLQRNPVTSVEIGSNNSMLCQEGSQRSKQMAKQMQNVNTSGQHVSVPVNLINGSTVKNSTVMHENLINVITPTTVRSSNPLDMSKSSWNRETLLNQQGATNSGIPVNLNHPACFSPEEIESIDMKSRDKENVEGETEKLVNGNSTRAVVAKVPASIPSSNSRLFSDGLLSNKGSNTSTNSKADHINSSTGDITSDALKTSVNFLDSRPNSHSSAMISVNGKYFGQSNSSATFGSESRTAFFQESSDFARMRKDLSTTSTSSPRYNVNTRDVNPVSSIQEAAVVNRTISAAHWSTSAPNLNIPVQPSDQSSFERLRGSEANEIDRSNQVSRPSINSNTMSTKGLGVVGRSFITTAQNAENRHGEEQDTVMKHLYTNHSSALPTSNGNSRVLEDQSIPNFLQVPGAGSVKVQTQLARTSDQNQPAQISAPQNSHLRLFSLQQQAFKDAGLLPYGNMPHFLQQLQLNNSYPPSQIQHMQLQLQNSTLPIGNEHAGISEVSDPKIKKNHSLLIPGISESGNAGWQYIVPHAQNLMQQGPKNSISTAPDLNVSLPPIRSPFDQSNGNEMQQPDLALQL